MKFVADLHIHSHYSRATSRALNFENLQKWAQLKGVQVVGTGDLSHPGWLQEMREKLEPAEEGLFRLKEDVAKAMQPEVFAACQQPVRFILTGEISNIYKKGDKTRKNHNVVFLPSLEAVERFQTALERVGNIRSDGRPILGLDARDLLEIVLETDPQAHLIPAHVWTPWFSLFGSKSGFDTIEECFEDLTPHIFALETGLSSDPPMNWRWSALDRYTLVSNSDAHSPNKLAREANLFDTDLSYSAMFDALQRKTPGTFLGTLEFFPEEGKYHLDGHRKCGVSWTPETTLEHNCLCPVCGKPVTVGVMHRIAALADREDGFKPETASPFSSLIPLPEILAEGYGVGVNTKRVNQGYEALLTQLGSELSILQDVPLDDIKRVGGDMLAEGIRRMRAGEVITKAGFDGEFGVISLFEKQERESLTNQLGFFALPGTKPTAKKKKTIPKKRAKKTTRAAKSTQTSDKAGDDEPHDPELTNDMPAILNELNPQQREAAVCTDSSLIIVAGPGTGKTRTLTHRIAYLLTEQGITPEQVLAITFTNKAAEEMAQRLTALLGEAIAGQLVIKTFHAFCAMILREEAEHLDLSPDFGICSEADRKILLKLAYPEMKDADLTRYLELISTAKNLVLLPDSPEIREQDWFDLDMLNVYAQYRTTLHEQQMVDFDDLLLLTVQLFSTQPERLQVYQTRFRWISVDEYQDLNFAQYRLLKLLKTPEVNLCVIGDPDQAIYGFRGATRQYFLHFQQDFPGAEILHLTQNYRSTTSILNASQQVIAQSEDSGSPEIWSEVVSRTKLDTYCAPTYKAEAEYVVHNIEKMVGGTSSFSMNSGRVDDDGLDGCSFGDFAVLYRLSAESQPLYEAFQRSGIPYQIVGQRTWFDHKDVQELLACLWLVLTPDASFQRHKIQRPYHEIEPVLKELRESHDSQPITEYIDCLADALWGHLPDDKKRADRFKRLRAKSAPFDCRLRDFLEMTVLHKESDEYDPRADRVTLMTLHASKGLEFPVVFIVGCEEPLIPYQRQDEPCNLDEERRLFYVGMTRAQTKLILTRATTRFLFGQRSQNPPSRFLNDIEEALKEMKYQTRRKTARAKPDTSQLNLF